VALATVNFKQLGQDVFTPNLFSTQESYTLWKSIEMCPKRLSIAGTCITQLDPCIVNGIGNPQVSWAVPVPIPVCTLTCDPVGFPDKTSHGSSKTVKYWVSGWLPVGLENLKPSSKHVSQEMPRCRLSEMFRNVVLGLRLSVNKQFQILIMKRGTTPPFSSKSQSQTFFRCLTTFYGSLTRSTLSCDINTYLQHSHSSL